MRDITVIGAGTMGSGIAQIFALQGFNVKLFSRTHATLDKAIHSISKSMDRLGKNGTVTVNQKEETIRRIHLFTSLAESVSGSDLIVEALAENRKLKETFLKELDTLCSPFTVFTTTTSTFSITRLAAVTSRPDKVVGMHFMNPVPVMPLVEIIRGSQTGKTVTDLIVNLTKQLGKTPVVVNDSPGFIASRLLAVQTNEAIYSLWQGTAGVKEIDAVIKWGASYPMGLLQLADYVGLDIMLHSLQTLYADFGNPKYAPCPLLVNMVASGHCGVKTGKGFYEYITGTSEIISVSKKLL